MRVGGTSRVDRRSKADGQEHPLAEAPGMVAVSTIRPRVLHTVGKKDDTVMGTAEYEVSDDGPTLTATVSGVDAAGR